MAKATSEFVIEVEKREAVGKGAARQLRREGRIPAVLYGGGKETVSITVDRKQVTDLLHAEAGMNTIFLLKLKGTKDEREAMIKEIQIDPLSRKFEHIDFVRITKGHKVQVEIPVELEGRAAGQEQGGVVDQVLRTLEIEVLPREIPSKLVLDISPLDIGDHLTVAELTDQLPKSARILDEEGRVVVAIHAPRRVVEEEEEAEGLVLEEQEEPELIGRGKDEDEEGEGEE